MRGATVVCGLHLVLISQDLDLICGYHKTDIARVCGDPRTRSAIQLHLSTLAAFNNPQFTQ